jgi:hypothetical protein
VVQIVHDFKLPMYFEVIVLHVGLDVSQNVEVIIIEQEDESIPCKILVCKIEYGNNIVFHSCIPLGDI